MKYLIRNILIFLMLINLAMEAAISEFSNEYELVYFYSHSCSHCRTFAPILRGYAKNNKLSIAGFLLNKNVSPINRQATDLPGSINADQEIIEKFFGRIDAAVAPALFLLNRNNLHVYPISQEALSYQELVSRNKAVAAANIGKRTSRNEKL